VFLDEEMTLSGTLETHGGSAAETDFITATELTNSGTIRYLDLVHTLGLLGDYTQTSSGTLEMRLTNGEVSDLLDVGAGTATLDGTLDLTDLVALNAGQTWTLITAGDFAPDFDTKNRPNGVQANFDAGTGTYQATS
jgi:hypothetical protein